MVLDPIITNLTDIDFYKLTIGMYIYHQHNSDKCTWAFKCRNKNVRFTPEMVQEIKDQLKHYCTLTFTKEELDYIRNNIKFIREDYIDNFLKYWHPNFEDFHINEVGMEPYKNDDGTDCGLAIETKGTWLNTSMYEIPILAICSEVYYAFTYGVGAKDSEFQKRTIKKFNMFFNPACWEYLIDNADDPCNRTTELPSTTYAKEHPYSIGLWSEFGTRRRYSKTTQDWLIKYIVDNKISGFVGTSNVYLAMKYGVKATGTMAHECIQAQIGRPQYSLAWANKFVMKEWLDEYGVLPGVYLGDTITTDIFLKDFTLTYAHCFTGVRHDSGDPIVWGEKLIKHYEKLGIDPTTKTLLFSDSLDFERATKLYEHFDGRVKVAFGIGTFLSNDCGVEPLNIVCKLTEFNGYPTIKISDSPGKGMCKDDDFVNYAKRCLDWRMTYDK